MQPMGLFTVIIGGVAVALEHVCLERSSAGRLDWVGPQALLHVTFVILTLS